MKNPFKKDIGSYEIAVLITMTVSDELPFIEKHVERYCREGERFLALKANMLDESQWLATACGVAMVAINKPDAASNVIKELMKVYTSIDEHNGGGTIFSEENMASVFHYSILKYLQEFFKGIDEEKESGDALARGQIYLCDVYNTKIFGEYPEPGSLIDNYTRELSDHFLILFHNKLKSFNIVD